jgi:hypothetical protein
MGYWREDVIRRIIEERISERIRGNNEGYTGRKKIKEQGFTTGGKG